MNVDLSGQPGTYEVEYKPENSEMWMSVMATIPSSSMLSLTLSGEDCALDIVAEL